MLVLFLWVVIWIEWVRFGLVWRGWVGEGNRKSVSFVVGVEEEEVGI